MVLIIQGQKLIPLPLSVGQSAAILDSLYLILSPIIRGRSLSKDQFSAAWPPSFTPFSETSEGVELPSDP